jgi:hypothetical protein
MTTAEDRFRAKIRRRGNHELWTGFIDHRGVGMVRINGKLRTVQRAAWEFAHGQLGQGDRVNACSQQRACVRVDHLSVDTPGNRQSKPSTARMRRPRGTGSLRELRLGVWQLAVTGDGVSPSQYQTFYGDADDAAVALDALAANVRRDLGDLRVRELVSRYLYAEHDPSSSAFTRDQTVLRDIIEPAYGEHLAADLNDADVETALSRLYRNHGRDATRAALGLTRDGYRWARRHGWTDHEPTAGLTLRSLR